MYRKLFVEELRNTNFDGKIKEVVEYLLKNEEASFTRAQLVLAWADEKIHEAMPLAIAIELLHCASLFHDDLPCMDNSNSRRGKDSAHIVYGESSAVLAGDAAIALAFSIISASLLSNAIKAAAIDYLSYTFYEMCDGQFKELTNIDEDIVIIHRQKTAMLIACACVFGALVSGQDEDEAFNYGLALGQNYQIIDDLKDNDGIINEYSKEEIYTFLNKNKEIYNKITFPNKFLLEIANKVY
jgi:geranylgeranyl pyrophosphate synthase